MTNRLFPPVEIIGGRLDPEFSDASASVSRPPQPLFDDEVLEIDACHWCCWSMWEKRLSGLMVEVDRYCALVSGWTSVPTLVTRARLLAVHSACRPGSDGCRPKSGAPASPAAGAGPAGARYSRGRRRSWRSRPYQSARPYCSRRCRRTETRTRVPCSHPRSGRGEQAELPERRTAPIAPACARKLRRCMSVLHLVLARRRASDRRPPEPGRWGR